MADLQTQDKAKRKKKATATVEKNINNINCSKFDLEFDVDPLFKKTSAQFDSGECRAGLCFCRILVRNVLIFETVEVTGVKQYILYSGHTLEDRNLFLR